VGEPDRRDLIIDATLNVCGRCGYETTTVDEIAAAADVTPSDFLQYFPDKDAVFMAVVEDLLRATAEALQNVDASHDPEQALLIATTDVLVAIVEDRGVITRQRMLALAQTMTPQQSLRKKASSARKRILTPALAQRLGVAPENRRVRQAVMKWSAVAGGAYLDRLSMAAHYDPAQDDRLTERMISELGSTFTEVTGEEPAHEPPDDS
jgi:AcrR family transcriptional regulator